MPRLVLVALPAAALAFVLALLWWLGSMDPPVRLSTPARDVAERPVPPPYDGATRPLVHGVHGAPANGGPAPAAGEDASFVGAEGRRVRGRVLDADGAPLPGADVRVPPSFATLAGAGIDPTWNAPVPAALESRTTTGLDGAFLLDLPGRRRTGAAHARGAGGDVRALVLVQHEGRATAAVELPAARDDPFVDLPDIVLHPGGAIVGRVVDEHGLGRAGVQVDLTNWASERARGDDARPPPLTCTTGADGAFELEGIPPGRGRLVLADGEQRLRLQREYEVRAGAREHVGEVVLPRAGMLAGRVVLADGSPCAGAHVFVAGRGNERPSGAGTGEVPFGARRVAVTDAAGAFLAEGLVQPSYDVRVVLVREGVAQLDGVATGTRDLHLVLQRYGDLVVRVLDAEQRPVRSAHAVASRSRKTSLLPHEQGPSGFRSEVTALADGTLQVFPAGLAGTDLVVAAVGYASVHVRAPGVAAGAHDTVTVVLPPEAVLRGRLETASGRPLAGVEVVALPTDEDEAAWLLASARTTHDGSFRIGRLAAGAWLLLARDDTGASLVMHGISLQSGVTHELPTRRLFAPATIAGTVTDGGAPLEGRSVTLDPEDPADLAPGTRALFPHDGWDLLFDGGRHTDTDAAGRFAFERVPAGRWVVSLPPVSRVPLEAVPGGIHEVPFELDQAARIVGRVSSGGAPLAGASVCTWGPGGHGCWSVAADGTYHIVGPPGTYELSFKTPQGVSASFYGDTVDVAAGERAVLDHDLGVGRIEVLVTDAAGRPRWDVQLSLGDAMSTAWRTGEDGRFVFEHLALRNWDVQCAPPGASPNSMRWPSEGTGTRTRVKLSPAAPQAVVHLRPAAAAGAPRER